MPERTDDEIIEKVYEALRKISFMRHPKDSRKLAMFLLAREMVGKARECLEEPYKLLPEPPCEPDRLEYGEASPGVGCM